MALLDILHFPDERLRRKAQPVDTFDDSIKQLVDNMFETMYDAPGIGLAAVQVNVLNRVIVIDISENHDQPMTFINPVITHKDGIEEMDEGCLSVPGIYEKVRRADKITVKAKNRDGVEFELNADGLLAVCIQHEIDHLDGKLFIDYLSELKRQRIRKKLSKHAKLAPPRKQAL